MMIAVGPSIPFGRCVRSPPVVVDDCRRVMNEQTIGSTSRLAVDNMQYLTGVLGIKDHIHKQKIALKAMDVVLFGPPRGEWDEFGLDIGEEF